ncbi:MAG TPA: PEP/pyruvate-binding domain-containing protein, partial [Myxococcales bacterium]|nr:PEP/pyruvate-binding domain-containing protein [Myxococcales bacterium]
MTAQGRRPQLARAQRASSHRAPAPRRPRRPAYVYHLDQLDLVKRAAPTWDEVRALLGGKGANLAEMTRLGLPVPPGFVVTTEACNAFLAAGGTFPPGMWEQV